jgi:chorismate mutase
MTTVHCEADMAEIERLRAEVEALRAALAGLLGDVRALADDIAAWQGEAATLAGHEAHRRGGYARALALTPERRAEIARAAGKARWAQHRAAVNDVLDVLDDSQPIDVPGVGTPTDTLL